MHATVMHVTVGMELQSSSLQDTYPQKSCNTNDEHS
jgi:hypothetical protein